MVLVDVLARGTGRDQAGEAHSRRLLEPGTDEYHIDPFGETARKTRSRMHSEGAVVLTAGPSEA